jgi:hypothetical protein
MTRSRNRTPSFIATTRGATTERATTRMVVAGALTVALALAPVMARAQTPPPPPPVTAAPADVPAVPPPETAAPMPPPVELPPPPPVVAAPPPPPPAQMDMGMAAPPPPIVTSPPSHLPSYLMWGVGGASLIVGAAFGFAAISAKSDFDKTPTYALADKVHDRAIISDVGLGLGLILAVTGTIFYFGAHPAETVQASNAKAPASPSKTAPVGLASVRVEPFVDRVSSGGFVTMRF